MSFGGMIRNLIDPVDPAVVVWLQRELPRMVQAGLIDAAQADAIAQRYRIGPSAPAAAPDQPAATEAPPPDLAASEQRSAWVLATDPRALPQDPPSTATPDTDAPTLPARWTDDPRAAALLPTTGAAVEPPAFADTPAAAVPRAASPFFADHAISIVLYLGAFLVVTSVAIFLAYSWGDIDGGTKLGLLIAINAAFLAVAALCLHYPSVRLAGRTFLAIGALLVPANVGAAYILVFAQGPVPAAVFWLIGALLSGGLFALLSVRLGSRAYGMLATLAVPIAADALVWLFVPKADWLGPPAALALVAVLAATRLREALPLAQGARIVSVGLLPFTALIALPTVGANDATAFAAPISLMMVSAGLGWEATRGGWTWWVGAVASLLLAPFVAIAIPYAYTLAFSAKPDPWIFVGAVIVACWIPMLVARRLGGQRSLLWDVAAAGPALLYPLAAWGDDRVCVALLVSAILLTGTQAYVRRSPLPLYLTVLAADAFYVKLLAIYGDPDSPEWKLGVALWPLGAVWTALAIATPRRMIWPFGLGGLVTLLAAAGLTVEQPAWNAGIALTAAIGTVAVAWRAGLGVLLLAAAPWMMLAAYQIGAQVGLETPFRIAASGLGGWALLALALCSPARPTSPEPAPAVGAIDAPTVPPAGDPPPDSARVTGLAAGALDAAPESADPAARPAPRGYSPLDVDWADGARIGAVGVTGLAALIASSYVEHVNVDHWLIAAMLAWIDLSLLLGVWAWSVRSRDVATIGALWLVPALIAGIARLHPSDAQVYAVPTGVYLLAVGAVVRRDPRPGRAVVADILAAAGLVTLFGVGLVQMNDPGWFQHVLMMLAEGLLLAIVGIWAGWRVLTVGSIAGVGLVALGQLADLSLRSNDHDISTMLSWLTLALMLGLWARSLRSRDIGAVAALAIVPALLAGIGRLHPSDGQAYALPIGLYLLAVASVVRLDMRRYRLLAANAIAAVGMCVLLGTGVVQAIDRGWIGYTILTMAEGLLLIVAGITLRWRALVVGGVAGVVVIALRELFDAVSALPGWAILGGCGLLLLGLAVLLLVARARLAAARRAAAERWSIWD